jgi:hypothetical protein
MMVGVCLCVSGLPLEHILSGFSGVIECPEEPFAPHYVDVVGLLPEQLPHVWLEPLLEEYTPHTQLIIQLDVHRMHLLHYVVRLLMSQVVVNDGGLLLSHILLTLFLCNNEV